MEGDAAHLVTGVELTLFWMLVAVAAVALITKRVRLPYTVALVIAGLIIALVPGTPVVELTPELIVAVFLPTLIFEAAYNLDFGHLRESIRTVSILAIPGVLLTAGVVAGLMYYVAGFDWPVALLFGAIVAATDPVSVVATFKELGAPGRLRTIIEGESLFNDGTALVLFRLILGIIVAGRFDAASSIGQFVVVIAGGLALGTAAGYAFSLALRRFDDYLVETVLTVILAYGTYFLAEELRVSGVIAVVAAGLLVGTYGQGTSFSPTSRIAVGLSWEFFGFLANSLIFLFVGLQVNHTALRGSSVGYLVVAIAAVLLSRAITVGAVGWLLRLLRIERPLAWGWQVVLVWGGLRGSLSLAMALSLPHTIDAAGTPFPHRAEILVMTFGVILFTLLAQGLTLRPLLMRLGLIAENHARREYERLQASLQATRTASTTLEKQVRSGSLAPQLAADVRADYARREAQLIDAIEQLHLGDATLRDAQLRAARHQLLTIERSTIRQLFFEGAIDEDSWRRLGAEIDARLTALHDGRVAPTSNPTTPAPLAESQVETQA